MKLNSLFILLGEMWVGVALAVLVELVPADVRTTAVAAYFFIISNIGGNMPLLVPPVKKAFMNAGFGEVDSLRSKLYNLNLTDNSGKDHFISASYLQIPFTYFSPGNIFWVPYYFSSHWLFFIVILSTSNNNKIRKLRLMKEPILNCPLIMEAHRLWLPMNECD